MNISTKITLIFAFIIFFIITPLLYLIKYTKININRYVIGFFALVLLFIGLYYLYMNKENFSNYKPYFVDPNRYVKIENRFTQDDQCNMDNIIYCSKYGKVAVNDFENNGIGCRCIDLVSGV